MYATLEFVTGMFDRYNALCFGGRLPRLPIRMSDSLTQLGAFVHPVRWPEGKPRGAGECHMRVSRRLDRTAEELADTIVHEMIHYYIWYTATPDSGPHGRVFKALMNRLNREHGLHMSVRTRTDSAAMDSDIRQKAHHICVTRWRDGRRLLTVCARTRLFEIHEAFSACPEVTGLEWWWSSDPWFNRFGTARTPKAMALSDSDYETKVRTSVPCQCDGRVFRPVASPGRRR